MHWIKTEPRYRHLQVPHQGAICQVKQRLAYKLVGLSCNTYKKNSLSLDLDASTYRGFKEFATFYGKALAKKLQTL